MPGQGRRGRHNWHSRFAGCGYRFTAPRRAIAEVLQNSPGHLSAEDIFMKVREKYPHTGLTTVYRTLDVLSGMGLVSKFDFGDGRARYEYASGADQRHHHHLVCTECRRVVNYSEFMDEEIEFLRRAEKGLSRKYGFDIKSHIIQFYGLCAECRNKDQ